MIDITEYMIEERITKKCSKCKKIKHISKFPKDWYRCRDCRTKRVSGKNINHLYYDKYIAECKHCDIFLPHSSFGSERNKKNIRIIDSQCRKHERIRSKASKDKNKKRAREYTIERKYGLSYSGWELLFASQSGKCAICKLAFELPSNAYTDHDHSTGEVRSLLCRACNHGIGVFRENPIIMKEAISYIEKYRSES